MIFFVFIIFNHCVVDQMLGFDKVILQLLLRLLIYHDVLLYCIIAVFSSIIDVCIVTKKIYHGASVYRCSCNLYSWV